MLDYGYYNMDCMVGMKQFPDKYFDFAVVDPQYGKKEHGGKDRGTYAKQKDGSKIYVPDGHYKLKEWDKKPPDAEYFREVMRVSKNQIIFGCNYFDYPLTGGRLIWDKCNDGSDQSQAEIAYVSTIDRVDVFRFMWRGMMQGKSIYEGTVQQGNKSLNEKRIHPTQKPIALYMWIAGKYLKPGDSVIDTHVGSASSLIAYHRTRHKYVGFEIDPEYYQDSNNRLQSEKAQINLFEYMEEKSV